MQVNMIVPCNAALLKQKHSPNALVQSVGWHSEGMLASQRGRLLSHTHDSSVPNLQLSAVEKHTDTLKQNHSNTEDNAKVHRLCHSKNGSKEACKS